MQTVAARCARKARPAETAALQETRTARRDEAALAMGDWPDNEPAQDRGVRLEFAIWIALLVLGLVATTASLLS